jgi:hypothetical protein
MSAPEEQSFKKHTRWDPVFHFFAAPIALLTVAASIWHEVHHPSKWNLWIVVAAIAATAMMTRLRMYSLMVQDRVIRLEERLRLTSLAAEPFRSRVGELTLSQLIALRFASDGEVVALAERALSSNLKGKQIKESIQVWRPDHLRV